MRRIKQGDAADRLAYRQPNGTMRRKSLSAELKTKITPEAHKAYCSKGSVGLVVWFRDNRGMGLAKAWSLVQELRGFCHGDMQDEWGNNITHGLDRDSIARFEAQS